MFLYLKLMLPLTIQLEHRIQPLFQDMVLSSDLVGF